MVIGCVGRLEPQKGHRLLLEAQVLLRNTRGDCPHLVIAGSGSQYDALRDEVKTMNLESRVHLLGSRMDIPEVLSAFDLFALPSFWEGLPLALLEAMALDIPVVASTVGGVGEVLNYGEYGIALPPGDVPALATTLADLLDHPEKRDALGRKGAERAHRDYSAVAMVHRLEDIYVSADQTGKRS